MLTLSEIRNLSDTEIQAELNKAGRDLIKLKLSVRMGQEKATHKVTEAKRYIAKLNTVINQFKKEKVSQ